MLGIGVPTAIYSGTVDDVSSAVTGASHAVPRSTGQIIYQLAFEETAPSAWDIDIEGSLDEISWGVIHTFTEADALLAAVNIAPIFIRAVINSTTGGGDGAILACTKKVFE
jgi:hypothetical protein